MAGRRRPGAFWVQAMAVLVLLFGVGVFLAFRASSRPLPKPEAISRQTTLIIGVDGSEAGPLRADSLMLLSTERGRGSGILLWIPRITSVAVPGRPGLHLVEEARRVGGPKVAAATVESLLGVKVDKYAQVNFPGILEAVDVLDGISVEVRPGRQEVVTREKALGLVRFADEQSADAESFRLQQAVLVGLTKRVQSAVGLGRLSELKTILGRNVITDLRSDELTPVLTALGRSEARLAREILPGQLQTIGVGDRSELRWIPDEEKTKELVEKRLGAAK